MQYLVTTSDNGDINWDKYVDVLRTEAKHVLSFISRGVLRNIWFTEKKDAVLLFECDCIEDVSIIMDTLPLVAESLIKYEVICLFPYTGFERIVNGADKHN